jgi:putative flippase GtrA
VSSLARRLLIGVSVKNHRSLLSSGISGVASTGVDLALLVVLVAQHVTIPLATFIAALTGAAASFLLNKYVAFRDRSPLRLSQVVRFDLVALVAALLVAGAMKLVAGTLGVPVVAAKLACAALVFAVWTYPAQRHLVFPRVVEVAS